MNQKIVPLNKDMETDNIHKELWIHGKGEMMEDTYTKILDKFAKLQYNPNTNRKDFKDYAEMKKVYTDHDVAWDTYFKDLDKAMSLAIHETRTNDIVVLEEMEKQANFFYEDSKDLTQKGYERGRYDSLHNAIAKLKEVKEVRFYETIQ